MHAVARLALPNIRNIQARGPNRSKGYVCGHHSMQC